MGMNRLRFVVAGFALALCLSGAGAQAAEEKTADEALFEAKCTLCHSSKRVYTLSPDKIKQTVERMRKFNPDWISAIESDHVAQVVARIVNDPGVMAARTARLEAIERGTALFQDKALGSKGKACADCHAPAKFRQVADSYPRWDAKLKRFVALDEAIVIMLREKVGAELAPTDPKVLDLLVYLKSL